MLKLIIEYINAILTQTGYFTDVHGLAERVTEGDITFPAAYCTRDEFKQIDLERGVIYHRKNGNQDMSQAVEGATSGCDELLTITYPMYAVAYVPRQESGSDDAYSPDTIANSIARLLKNGPYKNLKVALQADVVRCEIRSINTDKKQIWDSEYDNIEYAPAHDAAYFRIDYAIVLQISQRCLDDFSCETVTVTPPTIIVNGKTWETLPGRPLCLTQEGLCDLPMWNITGADIDTWNTVTGKLTKTQADTYYYSIANPSGYINQTQGDARYYLASNPNNYIPQSYADGHYYPYSSNPAGYELTTNKNIANGYAGLGNDGKINSSQLPAIAITDTFVVGSQAAMLALTAETGDIAVRTDLNKSFILKGSNPTVLANWQELLTPTDAVLSVNSATGAVSLSVNNTGSSLTWVGTDLRIPTATNSITGLLSAADHTTYNAKFTLPSFTAGSVIVADGSTLAQDNSNFFYDTTNHRLGVGVNSGLTARVNLPAGTTAADGISFGGLPLYRASSSTMNIESNLLFNGSFIVLASTYSNPNTQANSRLQLTNSGALIDRNQADANHVLRVQQLNASGTGDILRVLDSSSNARFRVGASTVGFFGSAASQQTSGANLTNNVTSGGTNDQIDNYSDLVLYANDAAAIRNNIYQLARKLKQLNDGLRTFGLFT